ncbi:MAG: AGE family epimerase/isomerase [Lachnospiraceae bacterium]|nr:AGE family epimerase/isomerase [Lachnospiraceae bacterium]
MFREEIENHLRECLLPFWMNLRDDENGGYYGYADFDLNVDKTAEKGCILNSRILWFFSSCYVLLKDKRYLAYADHAYEFLRTYFYDTEYGGVIWSVDFKGKKLDMTKHTYCQAFAIYGLSAYYEASGKRESLELAKDFINVIETDCRDNDGYLEAFNRDFSPASNEKLSENGIIAERTMNTLLHVFEAYTEFYRVTESIEESDLKLYRGEVRKKIKDQLSILKNRMFNPKKNRLEVFFDINYNSLLDLISYGHDIETAWLVDRGLDILGEEELKREYSPMTGRLAKNILNNAFDGKSLPQECEAGRVDESRVWWAQAEAINGFMNEYIKDPSNEAFKTAVLSEWEYIKSHVIYRQSGGEWYARLDKEGRPDNKKAVVEPWKCPYHNGRMCIEVLRRWGTGF